jgi:hypothetical protein
MEIFQSVEDSCSFNNMTRQKSPNKETESKKEATSPQIQIPGPSLENNLVMVKSIEMSE